MRLPVLAVAMWAGGALAEPSPVPMDSASRWSVSAEVLSAWFRSSPTPVPIITDDLANAPGVQVLLGGGAVDTNVNPGFKLTGAYRVDDRLGVELTGFYIPQRSTASSVSSTGEPGSVDLYLPYFDAIRHVEDVTEISYWPTYRGSAQATFSNSLGGGEFNVTWALRQANALRVDLLGGVRLLQLRESYTITTSSPYNPPNPADIWNTTDSFATRNRFYGVQVGARAAWDSGPWVGTAAAKVALGSMQQRVSISGELETNDYTDYGPAEAYPGGYFALPTNSGVHTRNAFAAVPEIAFNLGYRITPDFTAYVAYSFLYLSDVARPGNQINRTINPTQTVSWGNDPPVTPVGTAAPLFGFNTSAFWAQTLSVGVAFRF